MSFELRVKFSGLCLFLVHSDTKRVAVVMPDCRRNGPNPPDQHLDGEPAEPHVGYLRFDLANLSTAAAGVERQGLEQAAGLGRNADRALVEVVGAGRDRGGRIGVGQPC
ncbi:MAG: hypothetical protein KY464_09630, partial [Gemmatimonadetes bacterium]|nr:hypothetical protein [Gemmatimonadota bacterium]